MKNIFFTSDHHFGHANIIRFCQRPFSDVEEMNRAMIERWNEKVGPDDEVYHLGDFALMKGRDQFPELIDQLNGTIYLVSGNHEGTAKTHSKKFRWIKDYYELKVKDPDKRNGVQRIILFHYAMRVWRGSGRGNWHLYGHSHGTLTDLEDSLSFDVGVDCHDFYPISYEEVKEIMAKKTWVSPYADSGENDEQK